MRAFKRFSWKPLPTSGNLLPRERLRLGLPMQPEQPEINTVLSLDTQANKSEWKWCAVELHAGIFGYVAWKACCIARWQGEWRLSDGPLNQPFRSVVVVAQGLLGLTSTVELLFSHVAGELNVLKIKEFTGIPYRYGEIKP